MPTAMEEAIQYEKLRYSAHYIEYHVPRGANQGPSVTLLVHPNGEGDVAILFIPYEPSINIPPDFLKDTVTLHWHTLGSHIVDFAFYTFDPRMGDPSNDHDNHIQNVRARDGKSYLAYTQENLQMFCENSSELERTRGMTVDAAEDAKEMGCVEGDGFEMLKGLDEKTRATWMHRLKLDEKKVSDHPHIKMRAIFDENLKEPVAFLPFIVDPDGSVSVKEIYLEKTRRDWRHVRRVLFRSVHELLPGKPLWICCGVEDREFVQFLYSYGYEDMECNFWTGEYHL